MKIAREDLFLDFADGKIPTGNQFHSLIESIISRYDDGINKSINSELQISAGSDGAAPSVSLARFGAMDPDWVLSLNANGFDGLNFGQGNSASNPVLFLDRNTGNIGIGTGQPSSNLSIFQNTNGGVGLTIENPKAEEKSSVFQRLKTDNSQAVLFKNSSTRSLDGGFNTLTLRNDLGDLRLQSEGERGTILLKNDTGFMGINKPNPESTLDVNGDIGLNRNSLNLNDDNGTISALGKVGLFWEGRNSANRFDYGIYKSGIGWEPGAYEQLKIQFISGIQLSPGTGNGTGTDKSYVDVISGKGLMLSSGNLGIGTTNPNGKIDVVGGAIMLNGGLNNGSTRPAVGKNRMPGEISGYSYYGEAADDGFLRLSAGGGTNNLTKSFIDISGYSRLDDMRQNIRFGTTGQERMRIDLNGKIGIGTSIPQSVLSVGGGVAIGANLASSTASPSNGLLLEGDADFRRNLAVTGLSGFGTSSPLAKLHIVTTDSNGDISTFGTGQFVVGQENNGGGIALSYSGINSTGYISTISPGTAWRDLGFRSGNTIFYRNGNNESMRITNAGKLGLGTSNPQSLAAIAGSLTIGAGLASSAAAPTNGLLVEGASTFNNSLEVAGSLGIGGGVAGDPRRISFSTSGASPIATRLIFGSDDTTWRFAISKQSFGGSKAITDMMIFHDNGNVGIGNTDPKGKLHITTPDAIGNVAAWTNGHFVVGKSPGNGGSSGGVGISYSAANNTGYISSLSPGNTFRKLELLSSEMALYGAGNQLGIYIDNRGYVGVRNSRPEYSLEINDGMAINNGDIIISKNVTPDRQTGIYWHRDSGVIGSPNYGIYRTSGPWAGPEYQQLRLNFHTGIQLAAGTDVNAGYGKSYVDVVTGKGLMVSSGKFGVGTTTPVSSAAISGNLTIGASHASTTAAPTNGILVQGNADIRGSVDIDGDLAIGSDTIGAINSIRFKTGGASPVSSRLIFGTDDTGWQFGISAQSRKVGNEITDIMTFRDNGFVGIGRTWPKYPLHIEPVINAQIDGYGYLNRGSPTGKTSNTYFADVSVWATGRIVASEFNAISDQRVKTEIVESNRVEDLKIFNQMAIKDYNYIDEIAKGSKRQKGLIAQELQSVFPDAVSKQTEFIPSIFSLPESVLFENGFAIIQMKMAHGLISGEKVRLYNETKEIIKEVEVIDDKTFSIQELEDVSQSIFVYGKEVDDFMVVDYNKVFCLNVSATQEIDRKVNRLEIENRALREEIEGMKAMLQAKLGAFSA